MLKSIIMKKKSLKHLMLKKYTVSNLSKIKAGTGEEGDTVRDDETLYDTCETYDEQTNDIATEDPGRFTNQALFTPCWIF